MTDPQLAKSGTLPYEVFFPDIQDPPENIHLKFVFIPCHPINNPLIPFHPINNPVDFVSV